MNYCSACKRDCACSPEDEDIRLLDPSTCSHERIIKHELPGFYPRRGCIDCNKWLDPVRLNGSPT